MGTESGRIEKLQEELLQQQKRIAELEQANKKCKDTIQALKADKNIFDNIFNVAPSGIGMVHNRIFIATNPAVTKITGYSRDELIGNNSRILYPSDEEYEYVGKEIYRQVEMYGTGTIEAKWQHKDGTIIDVLVSLTPQNNANIDKGIIFTVLNISDRKKAEKIRRENEQRIAFHYNQTQIAVIEWDLDFKVINWNPAAENIFGFTKEEALGKHASFIVPEVSREEVNAAWDAVISSKSEKKITNTNCTKQGKLVVCDWHNTVLKNEQGEVISVASIAMEVTERERSEAIKNVVYNISNAVNSTENLNNLILQIRDELSSIIDTTNFYIALYNKEDDTLSLPFFVDEKDKFENLPAGKSLTAYVIRTKTPLLATHQKMLEMEEMGLIETFGSDCEIWLGVPLETENEVIGVLAVQSYTDAQAFKQADMKMLEFVSDQISLSINRKNTEVKMAEALEKAKESDQLKSSFLANMSHEIRTPMNGILGFASLLKNNDLNEEDRTKYISIVEQSGKRMLGVINDLIDISKIESGVSELNLSDFNLNNSLEYVYSFFKPEAETKGLELSYSTALKNKDATIQSDREKVYAILINLVKNAIKYTRKGQIKISYDINNNFICFKVTDTGIGIPTEKQEAVFNRFVQTDMSYSMSFEGVGLGLSITKAYAEFLGGKIWLKSEQFKGSTFYVEIPYIQGKKETKNTEVLEENIMDEKAKQKIKILLAEDDGINRKLFTYILKDVASELLEAVNGQEAIEMQEKHQDIDVILMDLKMPEMNGYEATRLIREKDKELKIIGLSAFAFEKERNKALESGFDDYISKPVSKKILLETLGKYFEIL